MKHLDLKFRTNIKHVRDIARANGKMQKLKSRATRRKVIVCENLLDTTDTTHHDCGR